MGAFTRLHPATRSFAARTMMYLRRGDELKSPGTDRQEMMRYKRSYGQFSRRRRGAALVWSSKRRPSVDVLLILSTRQPIPLRVTYGPRETE